MDASTPPSGTLPPFDDAEPEEEDGEDAFDEETGFFASPAVARRLPTDPDVWLRWIAAALVLTGALLVGFLDVAAALDGWTGAAAGSVFQAPSVDISLLLLGGVLVLLLRRGSDGAPSHRRGLRALACVAAAGAAALAVAQVAAAIEVITLRLAPPPGALRVFVALGGLGEAAVSAVVLLAAALLYRWAHLADGGVTGAEMVSAGPAGTRSGVAGVAAAALFGAAVSAGCYIAFQAGLSATSSPLLGGSLAPAIAPLAVIAAP